MAINIDRSDSVPLLQKDEKLVVVQHQTRCFKICFYFLTVVQTLMLLVLASVATTFILYTEPAVRDTNKLVKDIDHLIPTASKILKTTEEAAPYAQALITSLANDREKITSTLTAIEQAVPRVENVANKVIGDWSEISAAIQDIRRTANATDNNLPVAEKILDQIESTFPLMKYILENVGPCLEKCM